MAQLCVIDGRQETVLSVKEMRETATTAAMPLHAFLRMRSTG